MHVYIDISCFYQQRKR